ncbi:hypothetical protein TomMM35A_08540 [Sphingobium sp. TomMM35A]
MPYFQDVSWSAAYRRAVDGNRHINSADLFSILRSNWDVWKSGQPGEPMGLARLPHLAIVHDINPVAGSQRPVLAPDMSKDELEAGYWRQLRIHPNAGTDGTEADDALNPGQQGSVAGDSKAGTRKNVDPFAPDKRAPVDGGRARFLRKILGHDVTDCVLYLDDVRKRDERLFRLLLGKDYFAAFKQHPKVLQDPWPEAAQLRWEKTKGRDYLPPVLALALITESARLGHNQHGLLSLSFGERGEEIFIKTYLDAIPSIGGPIEPPYWLSRQVENSLFQTTALMPPDVVFPHFENDIPILGDGTLGRAWSESAATAIVAAFAADGAALVGKMARPNGIDEARKLQAGIAFHPRHRRQIHAGKAPSIPKGHSAAYWGMNWRIHPIVGLLDLARQAFDWSAQYREDKNRLRSWSGDMPKRWLSQAVAAISYCWVESFSASALPTALKPVLIGKRSWYHKHSAEGVIGEPAELTDDECYIDMLAEGANFGSICTEGLKCLAALPGPGAEGYTARYRAHLWFDCVGDDIVHYRRHLRNALRASKHLRRTAQALDPEMLDRFEPAHRKLLTMPGGRRRLLGNRSDLLSTTGIRQAALGAQDIAMVPSPFALDPIRLVIAEPHRWTGVPKGAAPPTSR